MSLWQQVLHASVPREHLGYLLNAALVGLAGARTGSSADPPPCLGLGLVRAVDMAQGLLYILSPLDLETLQQVAILQVTLADCFPT